MRLACPSARPLLAMAAAVAALLGHTSPAVASQGYGLLPPAFGALTFPTGVAVDSAGGNVYVVDGGGVEAVEVYGAAGGAPSGGSPAQLTGTGTPSGAFSFGSEPAGVAIDNSSGPGGGEVYVTDVRDNVVDKFQLNGSHEYEYLSQLTGFSEPLGVAVDANGDVYVADYGNDLVHEYDAAGTELRDYSTPLVTRPQSVTVDGAGNLYVEDYAAQNLVELSRDPAGNVVSEREIASSGVTAIAADSAAEGVFADFGSQVVEYDATGHVVAQFGAGTLLNSRGLAINEATGEIYADDAEGGVVDAFTLITLPDAFTLPASDVQASAATLNGSIKPNGVPITDLQFQYGQSSSYEGTVAASSTTVAGSVTEAPVSASLTGLEVNRTYHYRLLATSASGETAGADMTFVTAVKPGVDDAAVDAANVTRRGALLMGAVDAENTPTSYSFQFGTSPGYGQSTAPASAGTGLGEAAIQAQQISELQPGTTYHYRLLATNAAGTQVGADHTFTTLPGSPPLASTGSPEAVTQSSATITGAVDSRGLETSCQFELGTDTSYGTQVFQSASSGSGAESMSVALSNLAPATTYHYRLVASNEDGTSYGSDETFTTPGSILTLALPPAPVLVAVRVSTPPKGTVKPKKPKRHPKQKAKTRSGKQVTKRKHSASALRKARAKAPVKR